MPVTQYLERARQLAAIADRTHNEADKKKLLEIAEAWADLARNAAAQAAPLEPQPPGKNGGDAR